MKMDPNVPSKDQAGRDIQKIIRICGCDKCVSIPSQIPTGCEPLQVVSNRTRGGPRADPPGLQHHWHAEAGHKQVLHRSIQLAEVSKEMQ